MDANVRNIRGGAQVDKGGLIGYVLDGEKDYLQPGDNIMPVARAKQIRDSFHHQPIDRNGKAKGKPVTNGKAWKEAGWVDFVWPEPEDDEPFESVAPEPPKRK